MKQKSWRGSTHRALCRETNKRRYRSEGAADRASVEFTGMYDCTYRAYLCEHCRGWHLATRRVGWGPADEDVGDFDYGVLKHPVPPHRWPYGPPSAHEGSCRLHSEGLFCDCAASAVTR